MAKIDVVTVIEESIKVQQAWEKFGGSFTKGLSQALLHADIHNACKIANTWSDEWAMGLDLYQKNIKAQEKPEVANENL